MPPRGLDTTPLPDLEGAVSLLLSWLYDPDLYHPVTFKTPPKTTRNSEVSTLYMLGWGVPKLSREFGISKPRVYQILKAARRGHVS